MKDAAKVCKEVKGLTPEQFASTLLAPDSSRIWPDQCYVRALISGLLETDARFGINYCIA